MPKKAKEKMAERAKRPVGRPRKNLGTRVSDIPVTTLKPMPRRINVDSVALQRARMAYKRDYPDKPLTENQTRAFLDAMQSGKTYGPIGPTILGTKKQTTVGTTTSGFMDYYKQALDEKKSEDAAARGVIASVDTEDGVPSLRINPAAVSTALIRSLRSAITAPPRSTGAPPERTRPSRAKSGISISKTPRFTRTRNAPVDVTDMMGQFADALAQFQLAAGRPPTQSEAIAIGQNMQAGLPPFDASSIVLPGSAMVNGEPALIQRVETPEEAEARSVREAQEEAARRARRLQGNRSPTTRGRTSSTAVPGVKARKLTGYQNTIKEIVDSSVESGTIDPDVATYIRSIVHTIKQPSTSRSRSVWTANAMSFVQAAQQARTMANAPLQLEPAPIAPVEEEEDQEGYQDLGDVFNRSSQEAQQAIRDSAAQGNQTAIDILSAALTRGPDQQAALEAAQEQVVEGTGLGIKKKLGDYKLASVEFSDKAWNSASSLRWVRSAGLRPLKRAVHAKGKFVYHLADMSKFSKFDQQVATLKNGRKLVLVYGK